MRGHRIRWSYAVALTLVTASGCASQEQELDVDARSFGSSTSPGAWTSAGSLTTSAGSWSTGAGDDSDSTSGGDDDGDDGDEGSVAPDAGSSSTTGGTCPPFSEGQACSGLDLTACCEPCSPAPQLAPYSGGEFDCPIAQMDYIGEVLQPSGANFDCDDFAHACVNWAQAQGINACQVWIKWKDSAGCWRGHAVNAIERESADAGQARWSLIEPQNNHNHGDWWQPEGEDPDPPQDVIDGVCGAGTTECQVYRVHCSTDHPDGTGEACFIHSDVLCELFENDTGICSVDFTPLEE